MADTDEAALPPGADDERSSFRLGAVPDAVRKMLVAGVGALFMTEEGIRSLVKELKLPKEAMGFVLAQAEKTKGDIVRVVAQELRSFLESAKVREDLVKLLTQLTFEVNAEVKIKPRGEGQPQFEPHVRATFERTKRPKPRRRRR